MGATLEFVAQHTKVICHQIPEIKIFVHLSDVELLIIIWTTGSSDLALTCKTLNSIWMRQTHREEEVIVGFCNFCVLV